MEDAAHRKDDVAVSLVEVAMSTLRHQHQLHFLQGLEEYAGILPPALPAASLSAAGHGWRKSCCHRLAGQVANTAQACCSDWELATNPSGSEFAVVSSRCPSRVLLVHS